MRLLRRHDPDGVFTLQDHALDAPPGASLVETGKAIWRVLEWANDPLRVPELTELVNTLLGGASTPNARASSLRADLQSLIRSRRASLYVMQLAHSGAPPPQPQPQKNPPPTQPAAQTTLDGVVTDGSSNPLPRGTVKLNSSRTVTCDDQGRFDFGQVSPGSATLLATFEGFEGTLTTTVSAGTANHVTIRITNPTSVAITRSPKKIIHPYNESITFTATVQPQPAPSAAVYHWSVDGVEDTTQTSSTFTKQFTPAATAAERRKEYTVSVRVIAATAQMQHVRVAQNANVGTANVAQSNAGMDTFGWTDTSPVTFKVLTATDETNLQSWYTLTRPVTTQTVSGSPQYGRLQYSPPINGDMVTSWGFGDDPPFLVMTRASAFNWDREEFESMLAHETRHCEHCAARGTAASIWHRLNALGFNANLRPLTEMIGYYEYVQSATVSYKFMLDYGAFTSFVRDYNASVTAVGGMTGATQTDAKALVTNCYNGAAYAELREAASEGWDHHIDAPP